MKKAWVNHCIRLAAEPADFYAGNRKILRNRSVSFRRWKSDIDLSEIGYTKNKLNRLIKDYLHVESRDKAVDLWEHFCKRGKYTSASFTTYNHLVKAGATSPNETKETRGPCLQSVVLTLLPNRTSQIDVFYRTTEFFKKFPADLLLIDQLLAPFDFGPAPIEVRNFHFAGVTCHPMYCIVPAVLDDEPVEFFEGIRKSDPKFFKYCMTWVHRYLVTSRGITKFQQAIRTQRPAIASLKASGNLELLTDYTKEHYE